MTKAASFFICILLSIVALSQDKIIDSLKRSLEKEKTDSSRIELMLGIGEQYRDRKRDTSLWYLQQALELSRRSNYMKGELSANFAIAEILLRSDNYPEALQESLHILKLSEESHNTEGVFWAKRNLMWIYRDI